MTMINGVNFTRTGDPQADLKTYMEARGVDEATAKAELEAEFGIPQMVQANDVDEDSSLEIESTEAESTTSDSQAKDRKGLQEEIKGWSAKLKQATDAGDQWGIMKAQAELKTLQSRAYSWDQSKSSSTSSSTKTIKSSSSSSSSSSSTADSQAADRKNLQEDIKGWSAKLKQATDAGDQWGIKKAQAELKEKQTRAYNWDHGIAS